MLMLKDKEAFLASLERGSQLVLFSSCNMNLTWEYKKLKDIESTLRLCEIIFLQKYSRLNF